MGILNKILGDPEAAYLNKVRERTEAITALEPEIEQLSDEELAARTDEFKSRLEDGETVDDILPEAFAVVREAARRVTGMRHFDVQIMGAIALHENKIAEMMTGEGKTLVATAPMYLNTLTGKGAHLITVNDYLAKRDTVWMGQIYYFLGLSVGCITSEGAFVYDPSYEAEEPEQGSGRDEERDETASFKVEESYLRPAERRDAYAADITYGTNNEFGFDYLRDNMVYAPDQKVQRELNYAIIDEIDSVLIDEARTPLIISQQDTEAAEMYSDFARIVPRLTEGEDYNVDEQMKAVSLTEQGIDKIEHIVGVDNIYAEKGMKYLHYLEQALKAEVLFKHDRDYVVRDGEVVIVDEFTGRLMPGRRYSEGLHQAIEAKEGLEVKPESKTLASITFQNFFRMYDKLGGMTGTAKTSAEEFDTVYDLEVVSIPTHEPLIRKDLQDRVYRSRQGKLKAIVQDVKERHERGQPVLLGTTSIEKNEELSAYLQREGIPHELLNAKNHEREGEIIAQAGRKGAVTCATNMAGRGVDIVLGGNPPDEREAEEVREAGGLAVIGSTRHEARRIDNQLRGRSGRQGDPGSSQFYVSLEDDLMRVFGGERVQNLLDKFDFPEEQAIESGMVSRAIEEAQSKVENMHFDMRKHLLEYDQVLNKHRQETYRRRDQLLHMRNEDAEETLRDYFERWAKQTLTMHASGTHTHAWNVEELYEDLRALVAVPDDAHKQLYDIANREEPPENIHDQLYHYMMGVWDEAMSQKREQLGEEQFQQVTRQTLLQTLDFLWVDHLTMMDHLRDSVRLRAYGQRDPLVEYKREGHQLYQDFVSTFEQEAVKNVMKIEPAGTDMWQNIYGSAIRTRGSVPGFEGAEGGAGQQGAQQGGQQAQPAQPAATDEEGEKVGRNDPCPCGSGKKYKKCHGR